MCVSISWHVLASSQFYFCKEKTQLRYKVFFKILFAKPAMQNFKITNGWNPECKHLNPVAAVFLIQ